MWLKGSDFGYLGWNIRDQRGISYVDTDKGGGLDAQPNGNISQCRVVNLYIGTTVAGSDRICINNTLYSNSVSAGVVLTGYPEYSTAWSQADDCIMDTVDITNVSAGDGIRIWSSNNTLITAPIIYLCSDDAISLFDDDNTTINGVQLLLNSGSGIFMNGSRYAQVGSAFFNVFNNTGCGIETINVSFSAFGIFNSFRNGKHNFDLGNGTKNNTFVNCHSNNATTDGFWIEGASNNSFQTCSSRDDGFAGFVDVNGVFNIYWNCDATNTGYGWKIIGGDTHLIEGTSYARNCNYSIAMFDYGTTYTHNTEVRDGSGDGFMSYNAGIIHILVAEASYTNYFTNMTLYGGGVERALVIGDVAHNNVFRWADINNTGGLDLQTTTNNNSFYGYNITETILGEESILLKGLTANNTFDRMLINDSVGTAGYGILIYYGTGDSGPMHNSFYDTHIRGHSYGIYTGQNATYNSIANSSISATLIGLTAIENTSFYGYNTTFFNSTVWDLQLCNTTTVVLWSWYIVENELKNSSDYPQTIYNTTAHGWYGYIDMGHSAGDGAYNSTYRPMIANASGGEGLNCVAIIWTGSTIRNWLINGEGATEPVTQWIGGLSPGVTYTLSVDSVAQVNVVATARSIPYYGVIGGVWFNYSGGWSNKEFAIAVYTAPVVPVTPGGGGGGGPSLLVELTVTLIGEDAVVTVYDGTTAKATRTMSAGQSRTFILDAGSYTVEAVGETKTLTSETTLTMSTTGGIGEQAITFDFTASDGFGIPGFEGVTLLIALIGSIFLLNRRNKTSGKKNK